MNKKPVIRGYKKLLAATILYLFEGILCVVQLVLTIIYMPEDIVLRSVLFLASVYYFVFGFLVLSNCKKIGALLKQDKDISVEVLNVAKRLQKIMMAAVYTGFGVLLVLAIIQHLLVVNAVKYDFNIW